MKIAERSVRRGLARASGPSLLVVLAVAAVVLNVSSAPAAVPIGNPEGVALFSRMNAAYRHVQGVELVVTERGSTRRTFGRFVIALHDGIAVREAFFGTGRHTGAVVSGRVGTTYARKGSCWRRLSASDPRTLEDVGLPFPYSRVPGKAMPPTRIGGGWRLRTENREKFWFLSTQSAYRPIAKRFIVYRLDRANRIASLSISALRNGTESIRASNHPRLIWRTAKLHVKTLAADPTIPNPTPACP